MMTTRTLQAGWFLTAMLMLGVPVAAIGHPGHGGSGPTGPTPAPKRYGSGSSEPAKPAAPEPYRGQKFCPVTGEPLGSHGDAVQVDIPITTMGKPSFLEKIGLKKQQPQTQNMSIYVCCSECAAKVKSDPNPTSYLVKVIAQRGGVPPAPVPATTTAHGH